MTHLAYSCEGIDNENQCEIGFTEACVDIPEDSIQNHTDRCFATTSGSNTVLPASVFLLVLLNLIV